MNMQTKGTSSSSKITAFFIALALVFWNPLSFYLVYRLTPVYSFRSVQFFFWFIFLTGVVALLFLLKNRMGRKIAMCVFSLAFLGILFSLVVLVNGLMGPASQKAKKETGGFIFSPGTAIEFKTTEFNFTASINNLGLRDRDFNTDKGKHYRILCIGDSWTFGWGVSIEDTWPKKLEQFFREKGFDSVEVINAGDPGKYSSIYKWSIEKIVPVLKPDLVLLGMLQLDDLAQLYENNYPVGPAYKGARLSFLQRIEIAAKTFLNYSVNNILERVRKPRPGSNALGTYWYHANNDIINNLSRGEYLHFCTLDDSVKALMKSGNLNPSILSYFIDFPDRVATFNSPQQPATAFAIGEMNKDMQAIRKICRENKAGLVFVNLPTHYFTGHQVIRGAEDVLNAFYENNNRIDSVYRAVATGNNIPYIEMTTAFRSLEDKSAYFFRYDGHPTKKGHEKISELIGNYLIDSSRFLATPITINK